MEDQCNIKWRAMLKLFHNINRKEEGAIQKYEQIKELANSDVEMTPRQKSGIIDRCNYQIHLINNPNVQPFSNTERNDNHANLQLDKAQSNGKP